MPNEYDQKPLTDFIRRQGGSLQNLGASPTYTGAPAMRGTPANPYENMNQNQFSMQPPPQAWQPQMPPQMPQMPPQMPQMPYPMQPRMDGRPIPEASMMPRGLSAAMQRNRMPDARRQRLMDRWMNMRNNRRPMPNRMRGMPRTTNWRR